MQGFLQQLEQAAVQMHPFRQPALRSSYGDCDRSEQSTCGLYLLPSPLTVTDDTGLLVPCGGTKAMQFRPSLRCRVGGLQSSLRVVATSRRAEHPRPVCHEAVPRRILCPNTGTLSASGPWKRPALESHMVFAQTRGADETQRSLRLPSVRVLVSRSLASNLQVHVAASL